MHAPGVQTEHRHVAPVEQPRRQIDQHHVFRAAERDGNALETAESLLQKRQRLGLQGEAFGIGAGIRSSRRGSRRRKLLVRSGLRRNRVGQSSHWSALVLKADEPSNRAAESKRTSRNMVMRRLPGIARSSRPAQTSGGSAAAVCR